MLECLGCSSAPISSTEDKQLKLLTFSHRGKFVSLGTPVDSVLEIFMFNILINLILLKISAVKSCKCITYANGTSVPVVPHMSFGV